MRLLGVPAQTGRKAAFLDRDGVINRDFGYVHRVEDLEFLPGAVDAMRRLGDAGYLLVIVTNQSGIARGYYDEAAFVAITRHLIEHLASSGVAIAAVYFCAHLPDAPVDAYRKDCNCRKPRPGMIMRAIRELDVDPTISILVGDNQSDIDAGRAAGIASCFRIQESKTEPTVACNGNFVSLAACVDELIENQS